MMELGRCKNCKHFKPEADYVSDDEVKIGICEMEPLDAKCMKSDQMAVGYRHDGPICVGAEFGCIHFEAKDDVEYVGGEITQNNDGTLNVSPIEIKAGNIIDINADGMREELESIGIRIIKDINKKP